MSKGIVRFKRLIGVWIAILLLWPFGHIILAQERSLEGAWQAQIEGKEIILLFQDEYFTQTQYARNNFISSTGGPYGWKNDTTVVVTTEFDSENSDAVGSNRTAIIRWDKEKLYIQWNGEGLVYSRLDNGKAPLAGVWKISERMQDGQLRVIHQSGTRKTLKILTATRFQWFAIDPQAKTFSGTGGGTYTFDRGIYTENIAFFSRDNTRVGSSLSFKGNIKEEQWHHQGKSSKGAPIYEVWIKAMDL